MLLLAGVLGLVAAGTAAMFDLTGTETEKDDEEARGARPEPTEDETPVPLETFLKNSEIGAGDFDDTLSGGKGADVIEGQAGDDQIGGYGGDDSLSGGEGNDDLHGMEGDDTLSGDAGEDTLNGQYGKDVLRGGEGSDSLAGHGDIDHIAGGAGDDKLNGGMGDDRLSGDAGDDAILGGLDDDTLIGGMGKDTLMGGQGDDLVDGIADEANGADPANHDFLNGGAGDDQIVAGSGDTVTGGDGADTIFTGDWIDDDDLASRIVDFKVEEDTLVLVYDDAVGAQPEITLGAHPQDEDVMQVFMDGIAVAEVENAGDLTVDDIMLTPLSVQQAPLFAAG